MSIYVSLSFTQAETIHKETRIVYAESYNGWMYRTYSDNLEIYIQFEVIENSDITLLIFDSQNYFRWRDGLSSSKELIVYNEKSTEVSCELEPYKNHYIILDNFDNTQDVHVKILIQDEPFAVTSAGISKWIFLGVGLSILIPVILGIVIVFTKKSKITSFKDKGANKSSRTLKRKDNPIDTKSIEEIKKSIKVCPECNYSVQIAEEYCSYCGHKYSIDS